MPMRRQYGGVQLMRTTLLSLVLLALTSSLFSGSPAEAAIAFRFSCNNTTGAVSDTTIACTLTGTVNAGDTIVIGATYAADPTVSVTCSDTNNASGYTTIESRSEATDPSAAALCYKSNVTGGVNPTVTVTLGSSETFRGMCACVYSGVKLTSPKDASNGQYQVLPSTGADVVTTGTITTTSTNELLFGFAEVANTSGASNVGTGFTQRERVSAGGVVDFTCEDKLVAAAGNTAATFTSGNATYSFITDGAAFFNEADNPSPAARSLLLLGVGQ